MKVLVTGANGFIAKNLIQYLRIDESIELYLYTKKDSANIFEAYIKEADFIFNLVGVNRLKYINKATYGFYITATNTRTI